jgi:hypothetical protein
MIGGSFVGKQRTRVPCVNPRIQYMMHKVYDYKAKKSGCFKHLYDSYTAQMKRY